MIAGATRNLEADLAACNGKVRTNKKLIMSGAPQDAGQGCRRRTGHDAAAGATAVGATGSDFDEGVAVGVADGATDVGAPSVAVNVGRAGDASGGSAGGGVLKTDGLGRGGAGGLGSRAADTHGTSESTRHCVICSNE